MTLVRGAAWVASGVKPLLRGCGWLGWKPALLAKQLAEKVEKQFLRG